MACSVAHTYALTAMTDDAGLGARNRDWKLELVRSQLMREETVLKEQSPNIETDTCT
jgi:hypothetical protein